MSGAGSMQAAAEALARRRHQNAASARRSRQRRKHDVRELRRRCDELARRVHVLRAYEAQLEALKAAHEFALLHSAVPACVLEAAGDAGALAWEREARGSLEAARFR